MIYLDNASTTQIDQSVLDEMMPYMKEKYGNPGTKYSLGREAMRAIDKARENVANLIGASPEQIVFTSGGTEANNLALSSLLCDPIIGDHVVTTKIEHDSVLNYLHALEKQKDFIVTYLSPDKTGAISVSDVWGALSKSTGMVSVMYVNNETGVENPVSEIGYLCKERGISFHTDCVQAITDREIDVNKIVCDYLSISSHKIHGAKGVGALYVRDTNTLAPIIHGGHHQEFGLRGGTENVPGIVGFGKACELLRSKRDVYDPYVYMLKTEFCAALRHYLANRGIEKVLHINGDSEKQDGKIINLRFDNVDGETLVLLLDACGVCVSAGAACRSHESEPSAVLTAMGLEPDEARNSIRISFSRFNTLIEVREAAKIIADCVRNLYTNIR